MELSRRLLLKTFAASMLLPSAFAAERHPFDIAKFRAAQDAGRSILVHVTAPWCGTCKVQKPIVEKIGSKADFKDLVIFDIDFDAEKQALAAVNAQRQTTMVAFKGREEVGRSVGDTNARSIEALVRKAMQ